MTATGQNTEPSDPSALLTTTTSPVQTVAGGDVLMSSLFVNDQGVAHRIRANSAGNLAIKRKRDSAFVVYVVAAGDYIDGKIIAVGGTGSGSTGGLTYIAEI